jgi:hypothetical protein
VLLLEVEFGFVLPFDDERLKRGPRPKRSSSSLALEPYWRRFLRAQGLQVTAEEELERLLPKRVAVVEITLTEGTRLTERNDTARGTPEDPMSKEEIVAKARDLITPVLGNEICTKLIEKVFGIEQIKDVRNSAAFSPLRIRPT